MVTVRQDQLINKLLNQKLNGFFVEIVGYDGETFSNSLFLEKECGRSGLLVDANSCTYELMLGKDRNYFMKNACISNTIMFDIFLKGDHSRVIPDNLAIYIYVMSKEKIKM